MTNLKTKNNEVLEQQALASKSGGVLSKTISGAFYLIALQIISRLFTFVLNILMVTSVDTNILGVYSVQYQLLSSTILFLSRESIRRSCSRIDISSSKSNFQSVVNTSWLIIPIGMILSISIENFFLINTEDSIKGIENYYSGLRLFTYSSMIELASEPLYILYQNLLLFKIRTFVEGFALFIKTITTYYFVVIFNDGLKGFGYSQLFYSLSIFLGYFGYFIYKVLNTNDSNRKKDKEEENEQFQFNSFKQILPNPSKSIDKHLLKLTGLYTWQTIQKLLLTEGEKYILYFSETLVSQAIFSVVSNLGSLIVRFLFLPIEESCFLMFPKLFPSISNSSNNNIIDKKEKEKELESGSKILAVVIKFLMIIALTFICFAPNYSELLMNLLYSSKFQGTNAGVILGVYCVYVGFLSVNGVTEAFVHSVSKENQLKTLNFILIIIGFAYLFFSYVLCKIFNSVGIILANILNMLLRILYSFYFMNQFFKELKDFSLKSMMPHKLVFIIYFTSSIITYLSSKYIYNANSFKSSIIHIFVGLICFGTSLVILYLKEWNSIKEFKKVLANKSS
ncbi:hypothetical protein CYY_001429 [Polysphondylium violaceum]|uniref:Protein RFT1 homolog n=1 Tax=Polysphondylium violaceum TaxID=133409 RepID=A0A8J4Q114_9MYCE|nr:hypothetical protein CYY_001429 [Polysphondylium violaceum]